jgi:glycosyltransferase involved in cell wall biosynthesis
MPGKVVDLELTSEGGLSPPSARYSFVRALVRLRGHPLGYLDVANYPSELEAAPIRQRAARTLSAQTWGEMFADAWVGATRALDEPPISVVVCTRDRAELLDGCLAALSEQAYSTYEVIVVDNAPKDDSTRQVCSAFDVRYVVEPRPGLDWARNCGVTAVRYELVAYTDDDARPDPGWLSGLAAGFRAPDVTAATGLVVPAELDTGAQLLFEDGYSGMGKGFQQRVFTARGLKRITYTPHHCGVGCNMAFRKSALARLGGFDPALDVGTATGGGGDLDMFQRIIESDGVIVYRPDAIVRHKHRRSWTGLKRQLYDNGRAYSAMLWVALLRAPGRNRLRVLGAYWKWVWHHHVRRIARRVLRRGEPMPLKFLLAEARGALLGPMLYTVARRRASRLRDEPAQ